ncbi:MAG: hypothetical protein IPK16_28985 [Anaerolineales bacterium]|nr:hypothetical protein [Anaerolineales bacterium]
MLSDATLMHGMNVAQALLGVDALYRRESGDEDGLVVLNMSGDALTPAPYPDYATAMAAWHELDLAAAALPEPDRRRYYHQLATSTLAFMQWRTSGLPFPEQLQNFLHVPAAPVDDATLDTLAAELHALLARMGYRGDLAAQCAAWEDKVRVPPDQVAGVLAALFSEAWDRTNAVLPIPAPKSDGMQVAAVSGVAFNARCNYLERKVELNTDPVLTRPGLKHLALHECYPGHYVQFKLREVWYADGLAPADGLLSVVNTASSSPFEGIADNGIFLLDWFEGDDDRVQHVLSRYRSAIGAGAAWRLHALGEPEAQVRVWLQAHSLVGGAGWVDNRMRFIAAPARAVLIWSYWWGQAVLTPPYHAVPPARRAEFLQFLYGRMHSLDTVAMF